MRPSFKKFITLFGIVAIAAAATWMVLPQGSSINLKPLGIDYQQSFSVHLGLDLQGGSHLVYQADFAEIEEGDRKDALESARGTIERRVNTFGVSEPVIQIQGDDKIVVELPGISDINSAIDRIGQTALLEFKIRGGEQELTPTVDENGQLVLDPSAGWVSSGLSGKQLKRATADFQTNQSGAPVGNQAVVRLEFDNEGRDLFGTLTTENLNQQIAIFLDGQLISAPTVQSPITDGQAIISGGFTVAEAKDLASRLNSGALPVPIKLISQQNVGATLGQESVEKSLIAGILGLILIAIFMIVYYRFPGILSVIALAIYVLVSVAIFKIGISISAVILVGLFFMLGLTVSAWFGLLAFISYIMLMALGGLSPVTLTLAGIAGFILSIGMAVDANILIFERLKEELRSGKDINKAIEDGFARAWLSIRDSNVATFITTLILYMFGTPSIKGFAVTLSIGVLISMFSAITVTRYLLKFFLTSKILAMPWMFGIGKERKTEQLVTNNNQ